MESIQNTAINNDHPVVHNGPGSFVPDDVMNEFGAMFLDENICRAFVIGSINVSMPPKCPDCHENIKLNLLRSFWENKRIKCDRCGKFFTALTGTFLSGCHFDFREIILLAFMISLGVDDKLIAAKLKISAENVRLWRHRFAAIEKSKQIGSGENNEI